ncbi:hypothetical protein Q5H93_23630 [Hymenobacter sp. ASUV-10]|uniref:Uncharacterized protein n=1 Tax=Hymenobacter aranciens TaxID=3063996 RepID=A0ABT9BJA0_9BACT|nr:hypothetical protein [Hymenobacter sp. ASUV-10]MDO7877748.1 hypothetical protein [Hymenobacter sp. ASUV-10]
MLTAVEAGLANPDNHYVVNTTYFDGPSGPVLLGMLHLNAHTVWDLCIAKDSFTCSVLLQPQARQRATVHVGFAQVWQVVRSDSPQVDLEDLAAEDLLYDAPDVLRNYAQSGRPA